MTKGTKEPTWRTYEDWRKHGYQVVKGSKASWFDGIPMFAVTQVEKRRPLYYEADYDDEDVYDMWDFIKKD